MRFKKYARWLAALLIALGGLMGGLAGIASAATVTFPPRHPGPTQPAGQGAQPIHVVVAGGMPGWQIAVIAIAASLMTSALAVLIDRAKARRLVAHAH